MELTALLQSVPDQGRGEQVIGRSPLPFHPPSPVPAWSAGRGEHFIICAMEVRIK